MPNLKYDDYDISLVDEPMYTLHSVDNIRTYDREYILSDDSQINSKHGISLLEGERILRSCILVASGGGTGIHFQSAVIVGDSIYVAVGNVLCSLKLPSLDLQWQKKVDFAACFGVYYLTNEDCLITHGECDISCIIRNGDLVWNKSGKDIFTESFEIKDDYIEVVDFNHEKYRIRVKDGQIQLVSE